jgi:hypothetical protein
VCGHIAGLTPIGQPHRLMQVTWRVDCLLARCRASARAGLDRWFGLDQPKKAHLAEQEKGADPSLGAWQPWLPGLPGNLRVAQESE